MTLKTYPALKTFFHKAYNRKLNALDLQMMSSALGYAPTHNMYNILGIEDDDSDMVGSMATQYAAAAAGMATTASSTLGNTFAASGIHPGLIAVINQSIAPAFNQVVQNQNVLQHQIAAMSLNQTPLANPQDTGYLPDPRIPWYNDLTRLLLGIGMRCVPVRIVG